MEKCNFYLSQRTFTSLSGALLIRLAGSAPSPLEKAMALIASEICCIEVTDKSEFEGFKQVSP